MKRTSIEARTNTEQSADKLTPTANEIASLAVKLSKTKSSEQLAKAYDLLIAADQLIGARLADKERKALVELSKTFVPDFLGTPITFDEIIRERLLPRAVGEKGAKSEPFISSRQGLVKSLRSFFKKCVPMPPVPEDFPADQIKKLSQDYLTVIISNAEMPRHLFDEFKQWRAKRLESNTESDSPASEAHPVKKKCSVPDGN